MNYVAQISEWFKDLPRQRKLSLTLALTTILVLSLVLSWWALTPSYGVLFNHLDEHDSNRILGQLEQAHIQYQLQNDGKTILIEKNQVAPTRLKLMNSGMQFVGSVGFELFDKSDFGMTDFSQKINYQRALQGELERTIASLDEIRQARVHLVIPENHWFDKEDNQPKAAVTLQLKRKISNQQVRSIQQLITASVAHLQLKNVVVVDQNGNMLSRLQKDNSSSQLITKKTFEHYLNDKVMQVLQRIYPNNQFMVKIDALLNFDELQKERIQPQNQGIITHEKEVKHSTANPADKNKTNQDQTVEKSYQLGSEKEQFKRASGSLERLSISVVLPQNTNDKTLFQVERIVKSVVGFNEQRGDTISVEALISPAQHVVSTPLNMPQSAESVDWPSKQHLPFILTLFSVLSVATTVLIKRIRQKRRQLLLMELTQWLNHHE